MQNFGEPKMKTKRMLHKGISEMLAIVLGVVIAIAIGVTLFAILPGYVTSMSQQQRVVITSLTANRVNTSTFILTVSIKNLGTKNIANISTYISIGNIQSYTITPVNPASSTCSSVSQQVQCTNLNLAPGQERSLVLQVKVVEGQVQVGTLVNVAITATYDDKSSAAASATTYIM
jgi:hypothetical protein